MADETPEKPAKSEERDALQQAVSDLEDHEGQRPEEDREGQRPEEDREGQRPEEERVGQRPEALRQFAQSARDGEDAPKDLSADGETAPRPQPNAVKHKVATRLLHDGAAGEHPDPKADGVDQLPDRIIDRG